MQALSFCLGNLNTLAKLLMVTKWLPHFLASQPLSKYEEVGKAGGIICPSVYLENKAFLGQVSKALLSCMGIEKLNMYAAFQCGR